MLDRDEKIALKRDCEVISVPYGEKQILKGLDEFHRCAKFCTSDKPPKRQKRNDYESSNNRK